MGSSCVQAALAIIFKYVYKKYHGKKNLSEQYLKNSKENFSGIFISNKHPQEDKQ